MDPPNKDPTPLTRRLELWSAELAPQLQRWVQKLETLVDDSTRSRGTAGDLEYDRIIDDLKSKHRAAADSLRRLHDATALGDAEAQRLWDEVEQTWKELDATFDGIELHPGSAKEPPG